MRCRLSHAAFALGGLADILVMLGLGAAAVAAGPPSQPDVWAALPDLSTSSGLAGWSPLTAWSPPAWTPLAVAVAAGLVAELLMGLPAPKGWLRTALLASAAVAVGWALAGAGTSGPF